MEQPLSFTNDLTKIGLSENEAIVYETLIYKGERSASMLKRALPTSISRPMLYFILDRLVEIGLVIKKETKGKPASFAAEHPKKLENIILRKQEELEKTKAQFDTVIGGITSGYNLQIGKPYVEFFEGIEGIEKLYKQILETGEDFLLIHSPYDESHPGLSELVDRQIKQQIKKNIKVKAITPYTHETEHDLENLDPVRNVTRRIIKNQEFYIPAQIIIYGNKVAITSYKGEIVTTIIDNKSIRDTWVSIFNLIWVSQTEYQIV